ncbi:hypothetical protein ARV1_gp22 [Acidianus rod-shaped virus 1]|uniref:Uncharacterized protein n=1 Tax=Acidianus rod-shaped virus 1 TaxID=309181 RepID=Q50I49_9VIRU|nr:hypothetical protein ARV1_gp22 [Acidianus rod-shaped virus 1]CAI44177.1 hypothetical protein [Acidianus rod-shaped virus 1]
MTDVVLVLSLMSTTATTLFAITSLYYKIKTMFRDAVKDIVKQELDNLVKEISAIKQEQIKQDNEISYLQQQVMDIKKKVDKL